MSHHPTELLEAYALRLLSPALEQEVADHLADCAHCRAEVAAQEDALPLLAYAAPPHLPPPDLEDRLLARVAQIRRDERMASPATTPPTPIVGRPARSAPMPPRRVWVSALGALAAVVILALVATRLFSSGSTPISYRDRLASQARAALHAPHAQGAFLTATTIGPPDAVAVLATDPATDRGVLLVGHMPSLPSNQTYEFWLVHTMNGQATSTAQGPITLRADGTGELDIPAAGVTLIQNAGISVEPVGKPITTPDSPMLLLLRA
ncbi:MAG: anti-sigma factor [Ktedonobacterales bacterium]|nr:anti-sigma factor [Ktedonobacterales bacterium]